MARHVLTVMPADTDLIGATPGITETIVVSYRRRELTVAHARC